jgi:hypothetical protein
MSNDPAVSEVTYGTSEARGFQFQKVALSNDDTSGRPSAKDWETWLVRLAKWTAGAGREDCDGVVWPTDEAIAAARRLVDQMRTEGFPEPTDLVPSGDGGIVFSRRTGDLREEIEISESGDAELLLFQSSRLTHRTPW